LFAFTLYHSFTPILDERYPTLAFSCGDQHSSGLSFLSRVLVKHILAAWLVEHIIALARHLQEFAFFVSPLNSFNRAE
jgi:hypothetical protein